MNSYFQFGRKLFLFIIVFLPFFQSANAQKPSFKDIQGKWEGKDERGQNGAIEFIDSSRLNLIFMGSAPIAMSYKIDYTQKPATLDIYKSGKAGSKPMILKCLLSLVDPQTIKWQVFPGGDRPDNFTEDELSTLITLKKKE